jgi:DNA repair protein RadC
MPGKDAKTGSDKPHYLGHRQRLRERFMATGGEGMPDYELLELLLSQAIPRRDVKPLAKDLLAAFGSFSGVISAEPGRLGKVKGVGDAAIAALKLTQAAALRLAQGQVMARDVLGSWDKLMDYIQSAMGHEKIEQLRLLFLNTRNMLIADEVHQRGTVNHTPLYTREVVKRALELGASALIIVHNHPSGDPTPSGDDIAMTKEVREALAKVGVVLHDHVVVGAGRYESFKSMGLL